MTEPVVQPSPSKALGYLAVVAMVALATALAWMVDAAAPVPNLSLIFVLPVVVAAVAFGWGPALIAVIASVLAYNYFLLAPAIPCKSPIQPTSGR